MDYSRPFYETGDKIDHLIAELPRVTNYSMTILPGMNHVLHSIETTCGHLMAGQVPQARFRAAVGR